METFAALRTVKKNVAKFVEAEISATEEGAKAGITYENTGATEPLVILRYFGPEVNPDAPKMGAYKEEQA